MSTTSVTMVEKPLPAPSNTTITTTSTCHKCGADLSHVHLDEVPDAQQRIQELENQIKILTLRATEAGTYTPSRAHTSPVAETDM